MSAKDTGVQDPLEQTLFSRMVAEDAKALEVLRKAAE